MKKLRSNFTTTEQSKRLLELGVPADSADMYYHTDIGFTRFYSEPEVIPSCELFSTGNSVYIYDIPCWSVGRLMEIFDICCANSDYNDLCNTQCVPDEYVAYIIGCYERATDNKLLDFSKLEE
jgi:hypothetical protein